MAMFARGMPLLRNVSTLTNGAVRSGHHDFAKNASTIAGKLCNAARCDEQSRCRVHAGTRHRDTRVEARYTADKPHLGFSDFGLSTQRLCCYVLLGFCRITHLAAGPPVTPHLNIGRAQKRRTAVCQALRRIQDRATRKPNVIGYIDL